MSRERICVIGTRETVLGFSLLGIKGDTPAGKDALVRMLDQYFTDPHMALILIEDRIGAQAPDVVGELQGRKDFPLVVEIPGLRGALEKESLKDYIAGAIGIRL
jgi:vacuolar-type H+-ATPase subunit F/Vma7